MAYEENLERKNCPYRTDMGNCLSGGGFCLSVQTDKCRKHIEEALEKQTPKKPSTGTNITTYDNWTLLPLICPCCGKQVGTIEAYTKLRDIKEHFCSKCGQAIDWSKV